MLAVADVAIGGPVVEAIAEVTGCACRIGALEATGAGNLIAQREALRK